LGAISIAAMGNIGWGYSVQVLAMLRCTSHASGLSPAIPSPSAVDFQFGFYYNITKKEPNS